MPTPTEITTPQLSRLIGLPNGRTLVDVRPEADFSADPRLIPGSIRAPSELDKWPSEFKCKRLILICHDGAGVSQGAAAWLRTDGVAGFTAWQVAGQPLLRTAVLPGRDNQGRTIWVTRLGPRLIASHVRGSSAASLIREPSSYL
jgi:rhodanese-related sulfurtransferase